MRLAAALLLMLAMALPAAAQTNTPTPVETPDPAALGLPPVIVPTVNGTYTPTPSPQATMTTIALTDYWGMFQFNTPTPFAFQQSTLDFASWLTVTPGGPFAYPDPPDFSNTTANDRPDGFVAVSDFNLGQLMVYIIRVAIIFFGWFAINFPSFVSAARWLVIILMVLYGIYKIWKGSSFSPPSADGLGFGETLDGGQLWLYRNRSTVRGYLRRRRETLDAYGSMSRGELHRKMWLDTSEGQRYLAQQYRAGERARKKAEKQAAKAKKP